MPWLPRSPGGLIPKQCVASHQDLRPHSSQSEDRGNSDDAGDSDDDGDGDDYSNFNDGNVAIVMAMIKNIETLAWRKSTA